MVGAICGFSARPLRRIVTAPLISTRDQLALSHRRWPSGKPRSCAFCRSAPAVRFMALAIFLTGELLRECALSSRNTVLRNGDKRRSRRQGAVGELCLRGGPPRRREG